MTIITTKSLIASFLLSSITLTASAPLPPQKGGYFINDKSLRPTQFYPALLYPAQQLPGPKGGIDKTLYSYGKPQPPTVSQAELDAIRYGEFSYIRPRPNADWIVPKMTIAFRYPWPKAVNRKAFTENPQVHFNVVGKVSGQHKGSLILALDDRTVIFKSEKPFHYHGEKVSVSVTGKVKTTDDEMMPANYDWKFWTGPRFKKQVGRGGAADVTKDKVKSELLEEIDAEIEESPARRLSHSDHDFDDDEQVSLRSIIKPQTAVSLDFPEPPAHLKNKKKWVPTYKYKTIPADYPQLVVNVAADTDAKKSKLSEGQIFVGSVAHPIHSLYNYMSILDNDGEPIYFAKLPGEKNEWFTRWSTRDVRHQENGQISHHDSTKKGWYLINEDYSTDKVQLPGHNMKANGHDLRIRKDGTRILKANRSRKGQDLTWLGREANITMLDFVVQELDAEDNVLTEWQSWNEMSWPEILSDTYLTDAEEEKEAIDHLHPNSADWTPDGNYVVSNRHQNQVLKIHKESGKVLWRLGGDSGNFRFVNDNGFSYQHDARFVFGNEYISIYDNGNFRNNAQTVSGLWSRAVTYKLDEVNWTATKVWEYRNEDRDIYALAMGGTEIMKNGNHLIAWAGVEPNPPEPFYTEVDKFGNKLLELQYLNQFTSYRVQKSKWNGHPTWGPKALLAHKSEEYGDSPFLAFSWNGSMKHDRYIIYGRQNGDTVWTRIAKVNKKGFENHFRFQKSGNLEKWWPYGSCVEYRVVAKGKNISARTSKVVSSPKCNKN